MQGGAEERMEFKVFLAQELANHVLVEIGQVDDADLGLHVRHLVDDVTCTGLTDRELVFVGLNGVDHLHESLDGEHVVLGGDLAQLLAQEFRAVHGQGDALRGAGENLDAQLVLQFLDRRAQGRLGNVQSVGCLVHRAAFDDFDDVFQLQQCHKVYL